MPELPLMEESLSPSVPRSAPLGNLWATEDDPVTTGFAKSQEFALDSLLKDWQQYPSWPNYPDERNLPVGQTARDAWAKRRPLRLAELERLKAIKTVTGKPRTETPDKRIRTEIPNNPPEKTNISPDSERICTGCNLPLPENPNKTKPTKFHNDACRMKANRKR